MSEANARQVGGVHYKTEVEHWDFTELNGMGYLEGCATKYIARWRKKAGRQDLEKALHYIDKLLELHLKGTVLRHNRAAGFRRGPDIPTLAEFVQANELGELEEFAIGLLLEWSVERDLRLARGTVEVLIKLSDVEARDRMPRQAAERGD